MSSAVPALQSFGENDAHHFEGGKFRAAVSQDYSRPRPDEIGLQKRAMYTIGSTQRPLRTGGIWTSGLKLLTCTRLKRYTVWPGDNDLAEENHHS